jgi:hypothetical protein
MTDTYTLAYEACGSYFVATGKMPTVESIKVAIGIKSPTTISTAIKDWKAALAKSMGENKVAIIGIPVDLNDAFVAVWQKAQTASAAGFRERLAELETRQAELDTKAAALSEHTERVNQLVAITEQRYQEEVRLLTKDNSRLAGEVLVLKEAAERHQQRATDAEQALAVMAEQIRHEQLKLQRLETQYDSLHDWTLKRIEEEKERAKQQIQQEMKHLQDETTSSKQALEFIQVKCDQMAKQEKVDQERIISLERSLSDEKVKLAGMVLTEAKYQNELNILQENIRLLTAKGKNNGISK